MAAIQRFGLLLVAPAVAAAPPDFAAPAGGCTVGDCAEGYGRFDMPKGGSYEGDFAAGKSHGFGILEYHTGAIYRGAFVEGRREGYGSYVFEDGATFDGEYVGDRIFGYGAITKKDADGAVELYEGEAAVNAAMGIGRFRFRDGATYEGEVVAGKPHGDGRYYRADEFEFKGQRVPRRPTARARLAPADRARAQVRRRRAQGLRPGLRVLRRREAGPGAPPRGSTAPSGETFSVESTSLWLDFWTHWVLSSSSFQRAKQRIVASPAQVLRELEGEFDGLALVDDDEEAGEAAAKVGASAAKVAREAAEEGRAAADAARRQADEIAGLVAAERAARKGADDARAADVAALAAAQAAEIAAMKARADL